MILLDSSVLVDAFTGERRSAAALRAAVERGERVAIPALVLFEWLRGPRATAELEVVERLFPGDAVLPFGPAEARLAAEIYGRVARARQRVVDLAIAAHALAEDAELWTLNLRDFRDVPDLRVRRPPAAA